MLVPSIDDDGVGGINVPVGFRPFNGHTNVGSEFIQGGCDYIDKRLLPCKWSGIGRGDFDQILAPRRRAFLSRSRIPAGSSEGDAGCTLSLPIVPEPTKDLQLSELCELFLGLLNLESPFLKE